MIDLKLIAETIKSVAMISGAIVQVTDAIGLTERSTMQQPQQTVVYYCQQPQQLAMQSMVQQPIQAQLQPAFSRIGDNTNSIFSSDIPVVSDRADFVI